MQINKFEVDVVEVLGGGLSPAQIGELMIAKALAARDGVKPGQRILSAYIGKVKAPSVDVEDVLGQVEKARRRRELDRIRKAKIRKDVRMDVRADKPTPLNQVSCVEEAKYDKKLAIKYTDKRGKTAKLTVPVDKKPDPEEIFVRYYRNLESVLYLLNINININKENTYKREFFFNQIWNKYPNKSDKEGARREFMKLLTSEEATTKCLKALVAYRKKIDENNTPEKFIMGARSFFGGRYEEYTEMTQSEVQKTQAQIEQDGEDNYVDLQRNYEQTLGQPFSEQETRAKFREAVRLKKENDEAVELWKLKFENQEKERQAESLREYQMEQGLVR